jgi:hypothetical protein
MCVCEERERERERIACTNTTNARLGFYSLPYSHIIHTYTFTLTSTHSIAVLCECVNFFLHIAFLTFWQCFRGGGSTISSTVTNIISTPAFRFVFFSQLVYFCVFAWVCVCVCVCTRTHTRTTQTYPHIHLMVCVWLLMAMLCVWACPYTPAKTHLNIHTKAHTEALSLLMHTKTHRTQPPPRQCDPPPP